MKQRLNLRIDPVLLKRAKDHAAKERRTLTSLIEFALEKHIEDAVTEKIKPKK